MKKNHTHTTSGQTLLIIILLSVIVVTIGLSIGRSTTQDTRLAKLEEESKKAFAAAEAGLEKVLESGSTDLSSLSFEGISGLSATQEDEKSATFTTPLLQKDEQHTFYLADYNQTAKSFTSDPYSGAFTLTTSLTPVCDNDAKKYAVELIFIKQDTNAVLAKRMIDPCTITGTGTFDKWAFGSTQTLSNQTPPSENISSHLVLAHILAPSATFEGTKLTFTVGQAVSQGRTIYSTATTNTGVKKKVKLFRSNPQLPADFTTTSF